MHEAEIRILLGSVRAGADAADEGRLAGDLSRPFDGERLAGLALRHEVHPLLERALSRAGLPPSSPWRSHLRSACHQTLARNLILEGEIRRILPVLAGGGAPALVLKGPPFAREAFGGVGLRTSHDIDLWIRARDVEAAVRALTSCGYRPWEPLRAEDIPWLVAFEKAANFVRRAGSLPLHVDLHWDIASPEMAITADPEGIWLRAVEAPSGHGPELTFAREDLLLYLLIHAGAHGWARLKHLCDIDALVVRSGHSLDWDQVASRARSWRMRDIVDRGLGLSRSLLGTALPGRALASLGGNSREPDPLGDPSSFLLSRNGRSPGTLGGWAGRLRARRGFASRLRQLRGSLHPKLNDFLVWPGGARHPALFWFLRPIRLAGRLAREWAGGPGPIPESSAPRSRPCSAPAPGRTTTASLARSGTTTRNSIRPARLTVDPPARRR